MVGSFEFNNKLKSYNSWWNLQIWFILIFAIKERSSLIVLFAVVFYANIPSSFSLYWFDTKWAWYVLARPMSVLPKPQPSGSYLPSLCSTYLAYLIQSPGFQSLDILTLKNPAESLFYIWYCLSTYSNNAINYSKFIMIYLLINARISTCSASSSNSTFKDWGRNASWPVKITK